MFRVGSLIFLSLLFVVRIPCVFLLQGFPCLLECFSVLSQLFKGLPGRELCFFFGHFPSFFTEKKSKERKISVNVSLRPIFAILIGVRRPQT